MAIQKRWTASLTFDGNPNGDPDAGKLPRVDAETGRLVTDSLKRKIRNLWHLQRRVRHLFKEKAVLAATGLFGNEDDLKGVNQRNSATNLAGANVHELLDIRAFGVS